MTPTMVANVEVFVNKDHRVTLQEVAKAVELRQSVATSNITQTKMYEQGNC